MLCAVSPGVGAQLFPQQTSTAGDIPEGYCVSTEIVTTHEEGVLAGMTTYRLYLECENEQDWLSAIGGVAEFPLVFSSSTGTWWNSNLNTSATVSGINSAFFVLFPNLAYDSYVTLGAQDALELPGNDISSAFGYIDPRPQFASTNSGDFSDGGFYGSNITVDDEVGGSFYVIFDNNYDPNNTAFAHEDLRILIMQITTDGVFSGQALFQIFMNADQEQTVRGVLSFDSCVPAGCTDESACNFDDNAIEDDGSCSVDSDEDGVCDNLDECIGEIDTCGVCNGPGAIYDCGCSDIPEGDCDCDGNQLDALLECGGDCAEDHDADGICDDVDACVGDYDACGVCNGPGAIYECGCADIPEGDCDCDGNQLDALGVCGGDCAADADTDGICDDIDDCVGTFDACGVCNGPGEIYECGCVNIPAGECDCAGNVLDECGVCGGTGIQQGFCDCEGNVLDAVGACGGDCISDVNNNGICDLEELENISGEEFCGQGTIWDEDSQLCVPLVNPSDLNLDGCVDVQDFMGHLAAFGEGCNGNPQTSLWQCGDPIEYQGYDYETVQIGEQCWFAENLRATNYEDGFPIPESLSDTDWASTILGATAVYGEGSSSCQDDSPDGNACDEEWSITQFGRLYNWYSVNDPRGLCPSGWHVPSDNEWTSMIDNVGGETVAGENLKSEYGWWSGGNGSDFYGFSALPSGLRGETSGNFALAGVNAVWWTSTPRGSEDAWDRVLDSSSDDVLRQYGGRGYGMAIRCLKD